MARKAVKSAMQKPWYKRSKYLVPGATVASGALAALITSAFSTDPPRTAPEIKVVAQATAGGNLLTPTPAPPLAAPAAEGPAPSTQAPSKVARTGRDGGHLQRAGIQIAGTEPKPGSVGRTDEAAPAPTVVAGPVANYGVIANRTGDVQVNNYDLGHLERDDE